MKKVVMVTKNEYKIKSIKAVLEPKGIQVEIENFYVPEIQADCCEDVAAFGAKFAANHCGKPVIKADSGMYIEVLNGLPGIYTSQFQKKLGVEKVLKSKNSLRTSFLSTGGRVKGVCKRIRRKNR